MYSITDILRTAKWAWHIQPHSMDFHKSSKTVVDQLPHKNRESNEGVGILKTSIIRENLQSYFIHIWRGHLQFTPQSKTILKKYAVFNITRIASVVRHLVFNYKMNWKLIFKFNRIWRSIIHKRCNKAQTGVRQAEIGVQKFCKLDVWSKT